MPIVLPHHRRLSSSASYLSLSTDISVDATTPLLSSSLPRGRRLATGVVALVLIAVFVLAAPGDVEAGLRGWTAPPPAREVPVQEVVMLPLPVVEDEKEEGRTRWKATPKEEELRSFRWQAEPDATLLRAVKELNEDDRRTRAWLLSTRPNSLRGTPIGYAAPILSVASLSEGSAAPSHALLPRADEGPGVFSGGSMEKYAELLEEWRTGRPVLHTDGGKWQEAYKQLHAEIMSGEREPRVLEYWCRDRLECGGLADRMLGMTSTFLLALLTDRAFVASWEHPIPLSLLFDSPSIDWSEGSFPALPFIPPQQGGREPHVLHGNKTLTRGKKKWYLHNQEVGAEELYEGISETGHALGLAEEPWVRLDRLNRGIAINAFHSPSLLPQLSSLGFTSTTIYAQLVHFLFRPKLEVLMFISEYTSLFALPSVFSIGIQVRTGDAFMESAKMDKVNTVERHRHIFQCAEEVAETYAAPGQRPLYFLITDSSTLRQSALSAFPSKVIVSGLSQHHNELRRHGRKPETVTHEKSGGSASVREMKREMEGLQNSVAESWAFAGVDFALLTDKSGFGKIPTFMHAKSGRAIILPRAGADPRKPKANQTAFNEVHMPSCRLESTLATFTDLASDWSMG
ncbi:hypothetical protein JCM8097_000194 [Rhodosporidiobolus ruineniae]